MSDSLDRLARALAEPMPRRRALSVLGIAVAGLWTGGAASGARAAPRKRAVGCGSAYKVCSPATEFCFASCCPKHTICSIGPRSSRGCPIHPGCCDPCDPDGSSPDGNGGCVAGPTPDYCGGRVCEGPRNHVSSVKTPSGADYGLANTQLRLGQKITAREPMELTMGDGSVIRLDKDSVVKYDQCDNEDNPGVFRILGGRVWTAIKKAVGGGPFQFETERAVIGVRGTTFQISYDRAKKRTTVQVFKGSVEMWRRSTPKRKLVVKAGQSAVQQGSGQPRLTKR
jgi:hypothetical protein